MSGDTINTGYMYKLKQQHKNKTQPEIWYVPGLSIMCYMCFRQHKLANCTSVEFCNLMKLCGCTIPQNDYW